MEETSAQQTEQPHLPPANGAVDEQLSKQESAGVLATGQEEHEELMAESQPIATTSLAPATLSQLPQGSINDVKRMKNQ